MKKILIILLTLLYCFTIFAPVVKAADEAPTWYNQDIRSWFSKVYDDTNPSEIFGERYTAAQVQWILFSVVTLPFSLTNPKLFTCVFSGDISACVDLIAQANSQAPVAKIVPSPSITDQILQKDRPLSGITYTKNLFRKFHIIPEAQAQATGFGFTALNPILVLWRGSRNITYVLLILATVIMSFMIMFRVKISPQVVISVQSAIPQIVFAIILITFSYAIAGFLIDLMYVAIGIVSLMFTSYLPSVPGGATTIFNFLTNGQPFGVATPLGVIGLTYAYLIFFIMAIAIILFAGAGIIPGLILALTSIALAPLFAGATAFLFIIGFIIVFIISVLLLIHMFRILWMLFKAFTNILLLTIFAPFQILAGVLVPSVGFGAWIKSYVANLAVFVVTGVLFLLSWLFLLMAAASSLSATIANPNALLAILNTLTGGIATILVPTGSTSWPPLLGGAGGNGASMMTSFVMLGASFVLFTLIPRTSEVIQGFISGRPFAFGTAIGEAVGPLSGAVGFVGGGLTKAGQEFVGTQAGAQASRVVDRFKIGGGTPTTDNDTPTTGGGGSSSSGWAPGGRGSSGAGE